MSSSKPASRQRENVSNGKFAAAVVLPSFGSLCIKQQVGLQYELNLTFAEALIASLPVWQTNIKLISLVEASEF